MFKSSRMRTVNRRPCLLHLQCYMVSRGRYTLIEKSRACMEFPMLWSGLVSRIGASYRVNLSGPFPLGQNYTRKITMTTMTMAMVSITARVCNSGV